MRSDEDGMFTISCPDCGLLYPETCPRCFILNRTFTPRSEQEAEKELWAPILRMGSDVVQTVATLIVFEKEVSARDAAKKERERVASLVEKFGAPGHAAMIRALSPEEGK